MLNWSSNADQAPEHLGTPPLPPLVNELCCLKI